MTFGGITNIPTSQSATAKLITKQFVTVRNRLVVITANITNVLPIIVIMINVENKITKEIFFQDVVVLMEFSSSADDGFVICSATTDATAAATDDVVAVDPVVDEAAATAAVAAAADDVVVEDGIVELADIFVTAIIDEVAAFVVDDDTFSMLIR